MTLAQWPLWKRLFWIGLILVLAAFWTAAIVLGIWVIRD